MYKKILSATVLGLSLVSTSASAISLTAYSDFASWQAAVHSYSVENFGGFTSSAAYDASPLDVGDFTVSASGQTFGSSWHYVGEGNSSRTDNDVNGSSQLNVATGTSGGTTLAFDMPIMAFGADWAGVSDSRVTSIDMMFSTLTLELTSGAADGFGMDNIVYGGVSNVPVPAAALLFAPALLGFAAFRRKSKAK